jgi:23S rRNA (uracil1939-C5)-methyltransferase
VSQDLDTVEIRGITSSGDGVATLPDGMTVFVPRTAPGDRVTLTRIHRHKRFARATADKVVVPGPGRVPPPCPHYDRDQCGSCQVMHLDANTQRAVRARVVGDALRRLARLEVADPEVVPADQQLGYRAKVTFAVARDGVRAGSSRHGTDRACCRHRGARRRDQCSGLGSLCRHR